MEQIPTEEAEVMPITTGEQQEVQPDFDAVPGDTEQSQEEEEDNAELYKPEEAKVEPPIEPISQGEIPAETQESAQADLIDLNSPRDQKPEEVLDVPAEPT